MVKTLSHIGQTDMEKAILPLKRKEVPVRTTTKTLVFTLHGLHDELVDEYGNTDGNTPFPLLKDTVDKKNNIILAETKQTACAKVVYGKTKVRYFIRQDNVGKFYNPIGLYSETQIHNKQLKHAGQTDFTYREVGRTAFIYYLTFLKSRNIAWYNNSVREAF